MQILLPIVIETARQSSTPGVVQSARAAMAKPLFFAGPQCSAPTVERAIQMLTNDVLQHLRGLARTEDQSALLPWLDTPEYQSHRLRLRVHDGEKERLGQFLWISYRGLQRWLLFTPNHPSQVVEIDELEQLPERLAPVISQWLKAARKDGTELSFESLAIAEGTQVRLSVLELDFNPTQSSARNSDAKHASMGGGTDAVDGATELAAVGRLLNAMRREQMPRGLGIDDAAEVLLRFWRQRARIALLLVGKRGVGKTTIVYEALYRARQTTNSDGLKFDIPPRVWLISPQRLMSGMSYLGQWEARLLAILKHAENRDLTLYFDDVLGLFSAGQHSGSSLSVGDVLLPWMEKQRVRVLAEMTPETWRVLRERRRDFADALQVHPVPVLPDAERWQVLAALTRQLMIAQNIDFDLNAVPCAIELCTRYSGDREFPGNIADQLRRMAARANAGEIITREHVIADFSRRLGLSLELLDRNRTLSVEVVSASLRQHLKGQAEAVEVLTEVILRSKTGMNDSKRPLSVLLLLGPTGVGKTQCAKALAKVISPGGDALLRIDLNEYTDSGDAARLVGTWSNPDGLLTAAIRRQPTAVVLFDELEKADPEVFDLLLSLLDEGRLTDAHGRVADFTRAHIVLTSNLGAREAQTQLGFAAKVQALSSDAVAGEGADTVQRMSPHRDAAAKFFRPEFFNRLDEIIGFRAFSDTELREITQTLLHQVLSRSGIRARHCFIELAPSALNALQLYGHDPSLGARAIKRGIERALVQPLAQKLALITGRQPIRILLSGLGSALQIEIKSFAFAAKLLLSDEHIESFEDLGDDLDAAELALAALDARLDQLSDVGALQLGAVSEKAQHYFACREQQSYVVRLLQRLRNRPKKRVLGRPMRIASQRKEAEKGRNHGNLREAAATRSAADLANQIEDLNSALQTDAFAGSAASVAGGERTEGALAQAAWQQLRGALNWLAALVDAKPQLQKCVLHWRVLPTPRTAQAEGTSELRDIAETLALLPGCQHTETSYDAAGQAVLMVTGFALTELLSNECGWTLDVGATQLTLSGIEFNSLTEATQSVIAPEQIIRRTIRAASALAQPSLMDLRSGKVLAGAASSAERLEFWLTHLSTPTVLQEFFRSAESSGEAP